MNKQIRLLIESFFDDEIFNTYNNIKSDIEDLGRYYDYKVGDIFYQNKKPYAICCGESKYFKDNKSRFCLLNEDSKKDLSWGTNTKLVSKLIKELNCFKIKYFDLNSFNDFKHIDENGYENTQIIKNNYDITKFPTFEYCLNLGDNIYLPAIDELQQMYLNKDKLGGKYSFSGYGYWSSTQYSATCAYNIATFCVCGSIDHIATFLGSIEHNNKYYINFRVLPFFHLK